MKLIEMAKIHVMTPWEIVEQALAHRKPPRNQKWLAEHLDETPQVISNWKSRGLPATRFRQVAESLGLTVDQIEGKARLPWDGESDWPFPGIGQERWNDLKEWQKGEIQSEVRRMMEKFLGDGAPPSGELSGSQPQPRRKRANGI